ncbi:MAG TPA: lysyl oxidase family protein [Actinomycetota bacterium]|nr:lysyl oxidase family protein [Actinomycetota bacterium]
MIQRAGRLLAPVLASLLAAGALPPPASGAEPPSLRLYAAKHEIRLERWSRREFPLDLGVWVTPTGGSFELRVSRPNYGTPVGIVQTDAGTGEVLRELPADVLDGWYGLQDFLHVKVRDAAGAVVLHRRMTFCPNGFERSRVDDSGPMQPTYPGWCSGNPFTLGTVWGIDAGWGVDPLAYTWVRSAVPDGRYRVRVWIDPRYVDLLGIDPLDAKVRLTADLVTVSRPIRRDRTEADAQTRLTRAPTDTDPAADTIPDLVALPAWGISVYSRRGRDYLAFGSTEWNAGPSPLIVEGFRRQDEDVMDAYQYFTRGGEVLGKAPVGTLEYHAGGGHDHWHFRQFTEYSLLSGDREEVQVSGKQSWCLAPTDAIDLTAPNAEWNVDQGLWTACGGPSAIWVREVLQVGWGDTYFQSVRGQAFDITGIPNGRYFIRVEVNPLGTLYETTDRNNVALRRIRIKGQPGDRRVVVPPWRGIDTEGGGFGY